MFHNPFFRRDHNNWFGSYIWNICSHRTLGILNNSISPSDNGLFDRDCNRFDHRKNSFQGNLNKLSIFQIQNHHDSEHDSILHIRNRSHCWRIGSYHILCRLNLGIPHNVVENQSSYDIFLSFCGVWDKLIYKLGAISIFVEHIIGGAV